MDNEVISIDGSMLEGGGQILRISVALSSLLSIPIRIFNIRGKRSSPGLKAQHKTGIDLVHRMTPSSVLIGSDIGSQEIKFLPNKGLENNNQETSFSADTKTAGSITLLAQIALPKALFLGRECSLMLRGGSDVSMSPSISYFQRVFIPNLSQFGASTSPEISSITKGYFPRGGGNVSIHYPRPLLTTLCSVKMEERGHVVEIRIISSVAGKVPLSVAQEMSQSAREVIENKYSSPVKIVEEVFQESNAFGNGSSITLVASTSNNCFLGGSAFGSHKIKPRVTGADAANDLLASILDFPKACVDQYSQDQLILYMALAEGTSRIRTSYPLTLHSQTAIKVIETLTNVSFTIITEKIDDRDYSVIECRGIAYKFK